MAKIMGFRETLSPQIQGSKTTEFLDLFGPGRTGKPGKEVPTSTLGLGFRVSLGSLNLNASYPIP